MNQNYDALKAIWPSVAGGDLTAKLILLNATIVTPEVPAVLNEQGVEKTPAVPAVLWPQANGWDGSLNQNDLVPAGIITDSERIDYEAKQEWITADQAIALKAWNDELSGELTHKKSTAKANELLEKNIKPMGDAEEVPE